MNILKLFQRKYEYVNRKKIVNVFCVDCTLSKYSCFRNGHWVCLELEDGTKCDASGKSIIDFTIKKPKPELSDN